MRLENDIEDCEEDEKDESDEADNGGEAVLVFVIVFGVLVGFQGI